MTVAQYILILFFKDKRFTGPDFEQKTISIFFLFLFQLFGDPRCQLLQGFKK
jgi:hypothetical protein